MLESDVKTVGKVMQALQSDHHEHSAVCDGIDEYFRKNFRKVSFEDARDIMKNLGFDEGDHGHAAKIEGLDGKFWVWETLEEATRPHVDKLTPEELFRFFSAWAI